MLRRAIRRWLLAAAMMVALVSMPAKAQLFCSRPEDPQCVSLMTGGDKTDFDLCRLEMIEYQNRVKQYVQCLRDEEDDVTRKLNSSIDQFNVCASGVC